MIELTAEECKALCELIDQLSGCSPETVFAWDGTDTPEQPVTRACAKVYQAAGHRVPDSLKGLR